MEDRTRNGNPELTVQSLVPMTVEVGHLRAFSAFQSHFKLDF
jgi:hypothetical protein